MCSRRNFNYYLRLKKKVDVAILLKTRYCAANKTKNELGIGAFNSCNSIITLLCATTEL